MNGTETCRGWPETSPINLTVFGKKMEAEIERSPRGLRRGRRQGKQEVRERDPAGQQLRAHRPYSLRLAGTGSGDGRRNTDGALDPLLGRISQHQDADRAFGHPRGAEAGHALRLLQRGEAVRR